jgi:chromosome segregation ATPase
MFVELDRLQERNPQRFERRMSMIAPQVRRLMEVMRTDPQRAALMVRERKLELETRLTAGQYHRAATEAERQRLRARLEQLESEAFDVQNERRQLEIRDAEARLAELRGRVAETQAMRDELIRRRVDRLLERPPPLPEEDHGPDDAAPSDPSPPDDD